MSPRRFAAFIAVACVGAGCVSERDLEVAPELSEGDLAVDVRGGAHVRLEQQGDSDLDVALTLDRGFDLAPVGTKLEARGRIERFPEAGLRLYSARIAVPSPPTGGISPCGGKPVALELALTRRLDNARVSGALSAYCEGAGTGAPVRVLRVTGSLPLRPAPR